MSKMNKYAKKQQAYFKRKGDLERLKKENHIQIDNTWKTQIVSDQYILLNPAFPVEVAYALLNVHNKINAGMLIRGTENDFKNNPNEVYRVIKERKVLDINKKDVDAAIESEAE